MARLLFRPPSVGANRTVRFDTDADTRTPADVRLPRGGPIADARVKTGPDGQAPAVLGPDGVGTLYLKTIDRHGTVIGAAVAVHGAALSAGPSASDLLPADLARDSEVAAAIAGLGAAFQPVDHTWAPGLDVKAGQIVEHTGTLYKVDDDMTLPGSFDTTGLTSVGGGGGGGAAPGPSGLMIGQARTANPAAQVVAADSEDEIVVFTGGDIVQGEDVWGTPGSALDLALTFGLDGRVVYPAEDAVYDIDVYLVITPNVADAGKPIQVKLARWFNTTTQELRIDPYGSALTFSPSATDLVFAGDTDAFFRLKITTLGLTQPVTVEIATATVVLRG